MNEKVIKLSTLIIAILMMINSAFADESFNHTLKSLSETDENTGGRVFRTSDAPDEIDAFVRETFLTYSVTELSDLGFSESEISSLELYPAISAYQDADCDDVYYYYPVVSQGEIIALITSFESEDGSISFQFGKTRLARAINGIQSEFGPASLVIGQDAYYVTYDGNEGFLLMEFDDYNERTYERISLDRENVIASFNDTVEVGASDSCIARITETGHDRSISELYLNVPFVANLNYNGGVCWASSLASIIKYWGYFDDYTPRQLRNYLIVNASSYTNHTIGSMLCAKDILASVISNHTFNAYGNGWSSYFDIMNCIDYDMPVYSHWKAYDQYNTSYGHVMVIRGYYYNTSIPDSVPASKRISVMDPNETSYVSIYYNSGYNIGALTFSLYGTVR